MDLKHQICPSTLVKNGDKQTPTRDRMLILIISMSFGKLLFIGDRLYIWGENRAQTKKKVHFRAFYMSMRIEGPISRSKSTQDAKKHTSNQLYAGTWIQGPTDMRKLPKLTTHHHVATWGPT